MSLQKKFAHRESCPYHFLNSFGDFFKQYFPASTITVYFIATLVILVTPGISDCSTITDYPHAPKYMFTVSKSTQTLNVLQRKSPIKKLRRLECSTGDKKGDKKVEGDERTPEGVYFVEYKRTRGLNYELYGNVAYVLNYPNPVDRIQGNSGHGIWLHGRGKELLPRDTQGCVALENENVHFLEKYIQPGETPVLIGKNLQASKDKKKLNKTAKILVHKTNNWSKAWERKSQDFFSYYAPQKYSQASLHSFQGFKNKKHRLFREYPWISVFIAMIRALPASNYWITYFQELFRSPEFQNQGIKRLYWQKLNGTWKIVGTEWRNRDLDLQKKYLARANIRIKNWLQKWKSAWKNATPQKYKKFYSPKAKQDERSGLEEILDYKTSIWNQEKPSRIKFKNIQIQLNPQGFKVEFLQSYTGTRGYRDLGTKTLIIRPFENDYKILLERWRPI